MRTVYRVVFGLIGLAALALQYWLVMVGDIGPGPLGRTINFFSYFTVICNLLAVLALLLPELAPASAPGRFFARLAVRTGLAAYIFIVFAVYLTILRHLWQPQGAAFVADAALHYVMPAAYLFDWLAFVPKGKLGWRDLANWQWLPLGYIAWSMARGALIGFYPYPFLDAGALGYPQVIANIVGLMAVFAAVGLGFKAACRRLA